MLIKIHKKLPKIDSKKTIEVNSADLSEGFYLKNNDYTSLILRQFLLYTNIKEDYTAMFKEVKEKNLAYSFPNFSVKNDDTTLVKGMDLFHFKEKIEQRFDLSLFNNPGNIVEILTKYLPNFTAKKEFTIGTPAVKMLLFLLIDDYCQNGNYKYHAFNICVKYSSKEENTIERTFFIKNKKYDISFTNNATITPHNQEKRDIIKSRLLFSNIYPFSNSGKEKNTTFDNFFSKENISFSFEMPLGITGIMETDNNPFFQKGFQQLKCINSLN